MKKYILMLICLVVVSTTAEAQFGKRLQNAVQRSAENAVTRKAEQKTTETVNKTIDKAFDPKTATKEEKAQHEKEQKEKAAAEKKAKQDGKKAQSQNAEEVDEEEEDVEEVATPQDTKTALEMTYAKSDFVAGDEIIFEDLLAGEQLGEFPSMWDLIKGNVEVALIGGEKAIFFTEASTIVPLMKNPKDYLPDVFTIEMDVYQIVTDDNRQCSRYLFTFYDKERHESWWDLYDWGKQADYSFVRPGEGDNIRGSYKSEPLIKLNEWNHIAFSFNKRAFKAYINGTRVTNIPNTVHNTWFTIGRYDYEHHTGCYIKNIRIARGAVPLYDRMMNDGKFITYGITFDVGKAVIKPESMGEINRIVTLMSENPDLKFSVEGHTDATGNAASNQTLSEARSKAIVDKLVEMGVASSRLSSSGKGQNSPLADNSTDEGRAKNRRVEFVKM